MWTLSLRSIGGEPQEIEIRKSKTTIGRRTDNDIVISDASASRYHAEILLEDGALQLRDLLSTNGTFVNRVRIEETCRLAHNDVIRIGECTLSVHLQGTGERLLLAPSGTHVLTRDVMLESIDQHAVLMYEAARKLNTVMDIDTALVEVSSMMKRALGADRCEVILSEKFDLLHDLGFPTSIARNAIDMKAAVIIPDLDQEPVQYGVSAALFHIRSVLCVPILSGDLVMGLIYLYKIDPVERPFNEGDLQLAVAISHQAALTVQRMRLMAQVNEEQRVRQLLERFVSPSEAEYIIHNHMTAEGLPGLSEQRVSVLFADIADSTGLAERLGPKRFGEILSRYYQEMSEIIFEHDGMVDKYLGDGIMAVFGMNDEKEGHEERAVRAGLKILEHIEQMNAEMSEELFIGVGVNTGMVVAGYVGTQQRVELTVLGDTVNVAAGLQSNARPNRLWIGPATMAGIVGLFSTQRVGSIRVKGRTVTIQAHEVIRHPMGSGNLDLGTPE
jgi:adenylate cyclase